MAIRRVCIAQILLIVTTLFVVFSCATSKDPQDQALAPALPDTWSDRSVLAPEWHNTPCDWSAKNRIVNCVFVDHLHQKAWTAGLTISSIREYPELKTWADADGFCRSLRYGTIEQWRLPTLEELHQALLTEDGSLRNDALFGIIDQHPAFARWPKYALVWTASPDPDDKHSRFAIIRGADSAPGAPGAMERPKLWLCMAEVTPAQHKSLVQVQVSKKIPAAAGVAGNPCALNYPGRTGSTFRHSAQYRERIVELMGPQFQPAIGAYGQLVLSHAVGFSYREIYDVPSKPKRGEIEGLLARYFQAVVAAVGSQARPRFVAVGHASPTYKGKFLAPRRCQVGIDELNPRVALDRARYIAKISSHLKSGEARKVSAISVGRYYPLAGHGATKKPARCGGFDCQGSKRVEIFFKL